MNLEAESLRFIDVNNLGSQRGYKLRGASWQALVLKAVARFMSKRGEVEKLLKVQREVLVHSN